MMWPSRWIELITHVVEVSGHTARYVRRKMGLAECYQYQQIWFANHGCWSVAPEYMADDRISAASYLRK